MQSLLVGCVFVLIFAATLRAEENEKIIAAFNKCKDLHKLSDEDLALIKSKESVPSSHEAKCMAACMLKEGKLLIGSVYMKENALMLADVLLKDDANMAAKAREVVEHCSGEVGVDVGPDECEFAYKLAVCSEGHARKIGLRRPL